MTKYRSWLGLIAALAVTLGVPALMTGEVGSLSAKKTDFDATPAVQLASLQPDYVFIGNSMMKSRIDTGHLDSLLGGQTSALLATNGIRSGGWYLYLKNHVLEAGVEPDVVFIFFQEDDLTQPLRHTSAIYRTRIDRLSNDDEPVYDSVIGGGEGLAEDLTRLFEHVYPVQQKRETAEDVLLRAAAAPMMPKLFTDSALHVAGLADGQDYVATLETFDDIRNRTNQAFELNNSRINEGGRDVESGALRLGFADDVTGSFLPVMFDLVKSAGTQLVFVRIEKRPLPSRAVSDSPALQNYMKELEEYIEQAGGGFIDMNGRADIKREHYLDQVHILPEFKAAYSEVFLDQAATYFK